jgi:hypothetical protein
MNQNIQSNKITRNNDRFDYLFHKWFVSYNPLYFISASCFIFGIFLVSRGMHRINWIDGQIILTAVIESYEILLLAGSFILYRFVAQYRPAIMLAGLNIIFLFDCTFQTEHISTVKYLGGISTVIWLILFALKLKALAWIFRLKIPIVGYIAPILGAIGMAGTPYLLGYTNLDKSIIHLIVTWYGIVPAVLVLWFRPTVICRDELDESGKAILRRVSNAAWMIWGGFYLYHLVSWIIVFDVEIKLANFAPLFLILPFVSEKEEFSWAGSIFAIILSLSQPSMFWFATLFTGVVCCLKGWQNGQPRLYVGAILAVHFSFLTMGWKNYPLPDPSLWLAVFTGIGLLVTAWIFRLISAFLVVLLGVVLFWGMRGPHGIIEWGSIFIALGFTTLITGIFMNWRLQSTSQNMAKGQLPLPLKFPNEKPADHNLFQVQKEGELRKKVSRILKDPCPYCKFNLRAGKDQCDECGKEFSHAAETNHQTRASLFPSGPE